MLMSDPAHCDRAHVSTGPYANFVHLFESKCPSWSFNHSNDRYLCHSNDIPVSVVRMNGVAPHGIAWLRAPRPAYG
ncbi:hypothetical protein CH263_06245 [Rhodococcus sp. 06-1059B-a]|nr:hypothetical protein CH263_06245 [Rhodococcus sp. 06-1059B-a]